MNLIVRKWGNSLAIRIPKDIARLSNISQDTKVEVEIVDGKLILKPVEEKRLTLDELLADITAETIHQEITTGSPTGNEIW